MGLSNREYQQLANEVRTRLPEFETFDGAVWAVLNSHRIRDGFNVHISEISKILAREKKKSKKNSGEDPWETLRSRDAEEGAERAERLHAGDPEVMKGHI